MVNANGALAIVDEQASVVQYDGEWRRFGSHQEYKSTTSTSQTPGSKASFTFDGAFLFV